MSARESVNMHVRMKNTMSYLSIEMKHKKSHILAVFLTKIKSKRINIAKKKPNSLEWTVVLSKRILIALPHTHTYTFTHSHIHTNTCARTLI